MGTKRNGLQTPEGGLFDPSSDSVKTIVEFVKEILVFRLPLSVANLGRRVRRGAPCANVTKVLWFPVEESILSKLEFL